MPTKAQLQEEIDDLRRQLAQPVVQAALAGDWETVRGAMLDQAAQTTSTHDVLAILHSLRK